MRGSLAWRTRVVWRRAVQSRPWTPRSGLHAHRFTLLRSQRAAWQHRSLSTNTFVSILTPPAVFVGLAIVLWAYKCVMMVVFQDKIIYMPSVPPFSRSEKLSDYVRISAPIEWREESIRSLDGTRLSLCIGANDQVIQQLPRLRLVILYFQGNASSLPPRLPMLSRVLKQAARSGALCTLVALSYRGFWTSSGSASQRGIERDAAAAIQRAVEICIEATEETKFIIWGQSIGAGVATNATAAYLNANMSEKTNNPSVDGLILETPFLSIRSMLASLYPQKWLPYRYLYPFLWNFWDSEKALQQMKGAALPILMVTAEKDEVVPADQGDALVSISQHLGLNITAMQTKGALHHEATSRADGINAVVSFLERCAKT